MSDRTLKALVGALVVAVGLWLLATLLSGGGGGGIRASGDIVSAFEGTDPASVETIRLAGRAGTVELVRADGSWTANGFEADTSTVRRLLSALGDLEIGDLAATNPANHLRMGVAPDSAIEMAVQVGGATRTLLVGNQGPRFGTAYGRLPDQDEVYVLEGDLRVQLRRPLDDWRNKNIAAVDSSSVARIEVERDADAYVVVRGDSAWALEDGAEVDAATVRGMLAELRTVLAAGFLQPGDSLAGLPQGGATRAFDAEGNILAEISFGEGSGERWARTPGDSIVYRLSSFRAGRLAPSLEAVRGDDGS